MAVFLRVGQRVVNLDLVTDVELHEDQVDIWFASPQQQGGARSIVFRHDEAKELIAWFKETARDVAIENNPAGFSMPSAKK